MKKIIFKNFLDETTGFFILTSCSVTIIVWVIQAVNYLDFVTEDGHGFKIYFLYTILSLPKIFNKLVPFMFFFSLFFELIKYEEQNQTIIFWTNGIKKISFLNVVVKYSLFFLILQLLLSLVIVPAAQDKARSFIRQSNIDYLPLLIKPKKFIDTVERLTIYSDKKEDDKLENIIIKDKFSTTKSKIIYAKKGYFTSNNNNNFLVLTDGKILNINDGKTTSFNFSQTQINLSSYTAKTTLTPKLQEVDTLKLFNCLFFKQNLRSNFLQENAQFVFRCEDTKVQKNKISQELFSRTFKPFYIPLLALIACFLILKSKNSIGYNNYKFKIFFAGVVFISISEIAIKFFSSNYYKSSLIFMLPFIFFILFYYIFKNQFNYKKS